MLTDRYGSPLNAPDAAAVDALHDAVTRFMRFRHGMLDPVAPWLAAGDAFPLAAALDAYIGALSTEAGVAAETAAAFGRARERCARLPLTERERGHLDAADRLLAGDLRGAADLLTRLSEHDPHDMVALAAGHQVDFLRGDAVALRDRVGAVLAFLAEDDPHYPWLLGMYAFGAEENGHWEYAERLGRRAAELDPDNVWAVHAVAHTFEERGRAEDGAAWLDGRRADWDGDNYLRLHLTWHRCLFRLDAGDAAAVLATYDADLAPERTAGSALEILNGSSLLWRLHLAGVDVGGRFATLADAWRDRAADPWYAFNDWHAALCFAGADDQAALAALIRSREAYATGDAGSGLPDDRDVTGAVGLPVCRAIAAFAQKDYDAAVDLMMPVRHALRRTGGSDAQRDVLQQTLIEAAVRAGRTTTARTLLGERIARRPAGPFDRAVRDRLGI
ncbi:tetratricopeptide repeat protein [Actinomadura atramentaria]|uniref:tetratricopeptide repeat protein n=1 Tax=Actinomadura atramentaria TaxID=1990 RepID=UPI00036D4173|nr:tetratricopeptide repeat protein [Actinomadura atramentaria]